MRSLVVAFIFLAGCAEPARHDPAADASYKAAVEELASMNRQAEDFFKAGRGDDAAAMIQKAQPVMKRVLDVSHPSLEAVEAASDLDDLYGRMLLANRHYGWAQMMFQKNLSRWKHWEPQTEETVRRRKQAAARIEECAKQMEK